MHIRLGYLSSHDVTTALTDALVDPDRFMDGRSLTTAATFKSTKVQAVQGLPAVLTFGPHGCTVAMFGRTDTPMAWGLLCQVNPFSLPDCCVGS